MQQTMNRKNYYRNERPYEDTCGEEEYSGNVIRSSTSLRVKEAFFCYLMNPRKGPRSEGGMAKGRVRTAQTQLFHSKRK